MLSSRGVECPKVCELIMNQTVSKEIEDYLEEMDIEHRHTTPLWPRADGEVERQNRSLVKAIKAAHEKGKN